MRARDARDRRARRGRYYLRDLAGYADIARLLANDIVGGRLSPDAVDDDPDDFADPDHHAGHKPAPFDSVAISAQTMRRR